VAHFWHKAIVYRLHGLQQCAVTNQHHLTTNSVGLAYDN